MPSPEVSNQVETVKKPKSLSIFRALKHRNFRLYWFGQMISLMGTWVQQTAMSWLLYRLTGSVSMLGLIAFLGQAPGFFIAPFAGTLADRVNRQYILLLTQSLAMLQALLLAYLTLTKQVQVAHLLALGMMMGIITGFETPVRQAFIVDMLDRPEDLGNAISLHSSVFNSARFLGPAMAGVAVVSIGEGWCFFANGVSYSAVIVALLAMRLKEKTLPRPEMGYLESIREGFSYAYRFEPIRLLLMVVAILSLVGLPYNVIMPAYAKDVLHGDAKTLGYLLGSAGAGALIGALWLAARPSIIGLGRLIGISAVIFGAALIAFSQFKVPWLAHVLLVIVGFGMITTLSSSNILLQTLAEDDKRGRVMSLYTMAFMGMAPFGSLLIGFLAKYIGISETLLIGGSISILTGLGFASRFPALRPHIRPIYIQKGILPG